MNVGLSSGPRVMISLEGLERAGLEQLAHEYPEEFSGQEQRSN